MSFLATLGRFLRASFRFHRVILIALGMAIAGPAAAQLAPTFTGPTTYTTGAGAGSIATADFNNDGHLDMAVVNEIAGNIAILLGDGAGNFSAPTLITAPFEVLFIAAGRFNNDAFPDLVATRGDGGSAVAVFINNGSGGFLPAVTYPLAGSPVGVAVGDFNSDNILDIAAVLIIPSFVEILRGVGDGTFVSSGPLISGVNAVATSVVAADFNNDGMTDLGVSVLGAFYIRLRTGDFTFAPRVQRNVSSQSPLAVGHFNNDNLLDVAIATTGGTVRVFLNGGAGVMNPGVTLTAPSADRVITADFNGDGHVDIAAARFSSDIVSIFLGDGAGNFTASTNLTADGPYSMGVGDFNEDTQPDLALTIGTPDALTVWLNTTLAVPGAPTGVIAAAGDAQVSVSFTAPANGGSPILDYTATCTPGPVTATGTASPIVVPGLTNGTAYTCTVRARNAIGNGPESLASNSATPQAVSVVAVATSGSPSEAGTAVTFTATVTGSAPTGSIDFRADAVTLTGCGAVPLAGGSAQCVATFNTVGTRAITAIYTGDAANTAGTGTLAGGQAVIAPTIAVSPATLPGGVALASYGATITATGGTAPHTFAVTAGALPSGTTLLSGGALSGVLTASGTFNFTVTATDSLGFTGSRAYTIAVAPIEQTILFGALVDRAIGSPPFTVSATGGASANPVTFTSQTTATCTTGGTNGATVTLLAVGPCTIRASQAGNATYATAADVDRTFNVTPPGTINLAPATLPDGVLLTAYAATITATGGAAPPYTFAITAGVLPGGIALSPAGGLGGTPAATGPFNFTVTATDSFGFTGSRSYTIAVATVAQTITFGALANLPFGSAPFIVSATGGASGNPVTFASQTPTTCTTGGANGATVTVLAVGPCTIRASQAGNATYAAAADVDRTFNVTPVVPQAPVIGTAIGGSGQASIAFTAPANTGGAPILDYTATCTPGPVSATGNASPIVVNGLTNGVAYSCTVTARNVAGTSTPSDAVSVAPNLRAFTGPTATGTGLATVSFTGGGPGCSFAPQGNGPLQSAFFIPVSGHPKSPPAGTAPAEFPHGLLDFVLVGCTPGSTMAFTVVYPTGLPAGARYWKYGPTPDDTAPHWYQLPATIGGATATFSIVDGGMGDDDLAANGTVVDQGGPGIPPIGELRQVPTLSTWAMILLAALLLMAAMRNGNFRGAPRRS